MVTADDEYYEVLKLAGAIVGFQEATSSDAKSFSYDLAKALLDVEERRQLALGELGEAVMKLDPEIKDFHVLRTQDILAGRIEV